MSPIKEDAFGADDSKPAEEPKKRRRTKKQMIAEATIPGDRDQVKVVFAGTGTEGERDWLTAVELFRDEKIEFKDKSLKYAVMKMDEQKKAAGDPDAGADKGGEETHNAQEEIDGLTKRWSALQEELDDTGKSETEKIETLSQEAEQVRQKIIALGGTDPESDKGYEERAKPDLGKHSGEKITSLNIPPEAEIGDEVRIGSETYRVGHAGALTQGPVSVDGVTVKPMNRWQRELGAGEDGPWEKVVLSQGVDNTFTEPSNAFASRGDTEEAVSSDPGSGEPTVEREFVDQVIEQVGPKSWKVGTGVLEKIGLPDYSSLQIGPNTMSTTVLDDGRRMTLKMPGGDGREITIPAAAVEEYRMIEDTVEYVTRLQRAHLISFLEAVKPGSTQPQS